MMNRLLVAACALIVSGLSSISHAADTWQVWVVQDGKKMSVEKEVNLQRKPFSFLLAGDKSLAYAVVATVERSELENLKSEEEIGKVIRATAIESEEPDRAGKSLLVHARGAIPAEDSGCQVWAESPDEGKLSFQEFKVDKGGAATARRDVEQIHFYTNYKREETVPVAAFKGGAIHVLITGLPPVGRMAHTDPKLITIRFR